MEELDKLKKQKINLLFMGDDNYPETLKNITQPPVFLYCKGDIKKLNMINIGVVGTRKSSYYGRHCCENIVEGLVEAGVTTVSGLALGIDTICHRKTLELKGNTVAVVGSGLDIIYPSENRGLWQEISEKGVLISEYPLGTQPTVYNFPQRNRIIAGLSKGVVVIESKIKGGSLITAECALEENRDVFAVPGEIFSSFSAGCNELIKNSRAKLVTCPEDILSEYNLKRDKNIKKEKIILSEDEKKILAALSNNKNLDEILIETGTKAPEALAILIGLEVKKLVLSLPGGRYKKI
ncbi:MAG: DNA-processing protein DprA [Fusobacteriaceae bacterium]